VVAWVISVDDLSLLCDLVMVLGRVWMCVNFHRSGRGLYKDDIVCCLSLCGKKSFADIV